jgi:hypothetical protein
MKLIDERKKPKRTNHLTPPIPLSIEPITDKAGLDKAYGRDSKLYTHGDTLYIAGTTSFGDFLDWPKIPLNRTSKTMVYGNALQVVKANAEIKNLVGHSLGGVSALELQKNFPDRKFKTNTYGAPVVSATAADNRFRNIFDPFSILDRGANNKVRVGLNPHSFSNFDTNKVTDKPFNTFTYTPENNNNKI